MPSSEELFDSEERRRLDALCIEVYAINNGKKPNKVTTKKPFQSIMSIYCGTSDPTKGPPQSMANWQEICNMHSLVTPIESVTRLRHRLIKVMMPIIMQVENDKATMYGMERMRATMIRMDVVKDKSKIVFDHILFPNLISNFVMFIVRVFEGP